LVVRQKFLAENPRPVQTLADSYFEALDIVKTDECGGSVFDVRLGAKTDVVRAPRGLRNNTEAILSK
jgi:hypothetical protein